MPKKDSNGNPLGKSRGIRRGSGETADWGSVDAAILRHAIATAALTGGALRCGYSRDGGAYAVGVYGDGEPYTEFVRPSEDIDGWLSECAEMFEDIAATQTSDAEGKKTGKKLPSSAK